MSGSPVTVRRSRRRLRHTETKDKGAILTFVLVTVLICSLIAVPMLSYIISVFRSGEVQVNRAQAIEYANGGTWVALSNQTSLYEKCNGGSLTSSLVNVTTTCTVLDTETLRPATEMPFHVATVQAGQSVPAPFANANTYVNPNTARPSGDPAAWLTAPDWTTVSTAGKVWLPELPVQATSAGEKRDTEMKSGTQDPNYSSCRVFFPGTFTEPITIAEPAYFTSGVYYFTQPIVLEDGADVVVGNGAEIGCTTDFEAISLAKVVPEPLNMSGLGGTFVLGDNGRITVDDDGTGNIRFAINQRYVSAAETSVAASSDVAIVSVNGDHAPFVGAQTLGGQLSMDVLEVPPSHVGTEGSPLATTLDYLPSVLTPKPTVPAAPTNIVTETFQGSGTSSTRGLVKVSWSVPNANGSLITSFTATDSSNGLSCTTSVPATPAMTVRPSCTIKGLEHDKSAKITVTATNGYGTSSPSAEVESAKVTLSGSTPSQVIAAPEDPTGVTRTPYSNGLGVSWTPPSQVGRMLTTGYRVTATPLPLGAPVTCEARWDETMCVLPLPVALLPLYDIRVATLNVEGSPAVETASPGGIVGLPYAHFPLTGTSAAPAKPAVTVPPRVPDAIVDFTTSTGTGMTVIIDGYVAVPQGRVAIAATTPATASVRMTGGVVAGALFVDPVAKPADLVITFDNPVAQKRIRLVSTYSGRAKATSEAIVQVNRSGSLAINSWVVQSGDAPPAPVVTTTTTLPPTTTSTLPPTTSTTTTTTLPVTLPPTTLPPTTLPPTTLPPTTLPPTTLPPTTLPPTTLPPTTLPPTTLPPTTLPPTTTTTLPPGTNYCSTLPAAGGWTFGGWGPGNWTAQHWRNTNLTGTPHATVSTSEVNENYGIGLNPTVGLADDFSIRWSRTITVQSACSVRFRGGSDDGFRLFVDGTKVLDDWSNHGYRTREASYTLTPGSHTIVFEFYERGGSARATLEWGRN